MPFDAEPRRPEGRRADPDHYPASVRQQTLRFGDSWARIAPWRGGGGAAHLVVGPDATVPPSVVHRCVERAPRVRATTPCSPSAVSPARVRRRSSTPASRYASASTCSPSTSTRRAAPAAAAAARRPPAATGPACSSSTTCRSTSSGGSARSGSRTPSTRRPATRFRVGARRRPRRRVRDHRRRRPLRLPAAGGGAPRRAGRAAGVTRSSPTACLGLEARRRPRLREHAVGERSRARALPVVRLRRPPRGPVRPRAVVVIRRPSLGHPRARGRRAVAGRLAARRRRRRARRPRADVRARRPEPVGRAQRRRSSCGFRAADVPAGSAGRADRARPAASRAPRSTRASAAAASRRRATSRPFAVRRAADRRQPATGCSCYPTSRHRRQRRVPARGRPAERERRLARALRHPRRGRARRRRRRADRRRAAAGGVGVAAAGRPRATSGNAVAPINPTTLADLEPTGRLGRQATQLGGEPRRAAHARAQPRDARRVERARGQESPDAGGRRRRDPQRRPVGPPPGAHRVRSCPSTCPSILRSGLSGVVNRRASSPRGHRARDLLRRPPRPQHRASRAPRRTRRCALLPDRRAPGNWWSTARSSRRPTRSTRPRTRSRCRRCPATTPPRSPCVATDPGLAAVPHRATTRPRCAPRTCSPGSRWSPASSRSITRGVAITNPDRWDADDTFVAAMLGRAARQPAAARRTTVAGLLDAVPVATVDGEPDGAPVYRQLAPYDPPAPPVTAGAVRSRAQATATRSPGWSAPTTPATLRADRALASSVSADWAEPGRAASQARELLGSIGTSVDGLPRPDRGPAARAPSPSRRARPRSRSASRTRATRTSPST